MSCWVNAFEFWMYYGLEFVWLLFVELDLWVCLSFVACCVGFGLIVFCLVVIWFDAVLF